MTAVYYIKGCRYIQHGIGLYCIRNMKKYEKIILAGFSAAVLLLAGFWAGRYTSRSDISITVSASPSPSPSLPYAEESMPVRELPVQAEEDKSGKININTASASELSNLSGIGQVLAERIVDYRTRYGDFKSVRELLNVSGIGQSKFEAIADLITV